MATKGQAVPKGYHSVTPSLVVADGAKAIEFYKTIGGTAVHLYIYQDNVDALWKRAVDAGAKVVQPLADQFWGDRGGCVEDPSGHQWWLAQHVKDLSEAELKEAAEAFFTSAT